MSHEETIKKTLDILLERAEKLVDLRIIKYAIDDYLDEGYKVEEYLHKYNKKAYELSKNEF